MATKKSTGLGAVYRSTTGAITTVFESAETLMSAGKMLAKNAETQAAISRIESSVELLASLGIEAKEKDAIATLSEASQLLAAIREM